MSGKHFSSSWLAVDSFTSAPLSITVRYGAVACVKPVGFTRRAASDPIPFPFPLSNGSDQNHKHEPVSGLKSVQKGGGEWIASTEWTVSALVLSHTTFTSTSNCSAQTCTTEKSKKWFLHQKHRACAKKCFRKNFQRPQGELCSRPAAARCAHLMQKCLLLFLSCTGSSPSQGP